MTACIRLRVNDVDVPEDEYVAFAHRASGQGADDAAFLCADLYERGTGTATRACRKSKVKPR